MRSAEEEYRRTLRGQAEELHAASAALAAALLAALGVPRLAEKLSAFCARR